MNQNIPDINLKIYSLVYDLSSGATERYDHEQDQSISFAKYDFFKLPAVKMTFTLPRRKRFSESAILPLNLTEGQTNVLFTRPEYYNKSLIFKSTTVSDLNNLMTQAGLSLDQKTTLSTLFANTPTESYVRKYENLEPFVRF